LDKGLVRIFATPSFDDFILRILADRIDFANHAIDALNR